MTRSEPRGGRAWYRRRRWWVTGLLVVLVVVGAVSGGSRDRRPLSSRGATATTSDLGSVAGSGAATPPAAPADDAGSGPGAPTIAGSVVRSGAGDAGGPAACRSGSPLANVYHPNRLSVLSPCKTVSGTVESVRSEDDGDTHFDLAVDPPDAGLLAAANYSGQHGWLVAEIVPADKSGCTPGLPPRPATGSYDYGICTGADEAIPAVGQHVWITGPYVLDEDHGGWAEIHPVWAVSTQAPPASASSGTAPAPRSTGATTTTGRTAGVRILSVTSPVTRGSEASLVAQTSPGTGCDLEVTLPSGAQSQSSGLGPNTADGSGRVQWTWRTGSRTTPGTATATVTCASASARADFEITS